MKTFFKLFVAAMFALISLNANASDSCSTNASSYGDDASLKISNSSNYYLTVKVMRSNGGGVYTVVSIPARSSRTIFFDRSGTFYTKLKAEKGYETLYKQDSSFHIQCDSNGYTEANMTFYVSSYGSSAGKSISRNEWEKNY